MSRARIEPDGSKASLWAVCDVCLFWVPLTELTERDRHQQRYCQECLTLPSGGTRARKEGGKR